MKQKHIFLLLPLLVLLAGCEKKFLESQRTGEIILSDTRDYDLLLNSDKLVVWFSYPLLMLSDDVQLNPARQLNAAPLRALYTWQDDIYQDQDPVLWTYQYNNINQYNVIIDEVDKAAGGTTEEKKRYKAEAKLGRAFSHFLLVNLYAKLYDAATSATDPGVPYITTTDMYAPNPGRSTVKDTYTKIINDVKEAIPDLHSKPEKNHRAGKAAAHGFLSRVYLFMGEYTLAAEQADLSAAIDKTILDYRRTGFTKPVKQDDPEILYMRVMFETNTFSMQPTAAVLGLLPATDIRKRLYIPSSSSLSALNQLTVGITAPEVQLNKAEALLRKTPADISGALQLLNELHAKRDNAHADYVTSDAAEALTWVLNERRRELVNSGMRWLDMRRFTKEGRLPAVTRTLSGTQYTLDPNSKKFTLMIPGPVVKLNPGMPQNDR
ncbi:MAG: RagB/SusD family nutrient uptake outer membrane protein [Pseudobacter sp.]|uniref:RagB/SusD family nutrient uptake outer membrane protein n=1 Tax=Pseudobacter sp. TaxID=2045420 RepID=UPI003F7E2B2C